MQDVRARVAATVPVTKTPIVNFLIFENFILISIPIMPAQIAVKESAGLARFLLEKGFWNSSILTYFKGHVNMPIIFERQSNLSISH